MTRYLIKFLVIGLLLPAAAYAAEIKGFAGVSITGLDGQQIEQCQPGQQVRYVASFSLERPGMAILHGTASGSTWEQKLNHRIRVGLKGAYTVSWTGQIPLNAHGNARVEIFEYSPLLNEYLVRRTFFEVNDSDTEFVGPEACKGCHNPVYTAWEQTLHAPYVSCESCHGPGGKHVAAPSPATIIVDTSADACKPCHSRNNGTVIEAQDGFIKSQQQYNEWRSTLHGKFMQCAGCHNPHYSVENDPNNAIKTSCSSCHALKKLYLGMQFVACESCHMAPAVKSETATGYGHYRKGDTASHIWRIKPESKPGAMFAGASVVQDGKGPFLTLDFSCLSCHNGSDARLYDFASVQQTATIVH